MGIQKNWDFLPQKSRVRAVLKPSHKRHRCTPHATLYRKLTEVTKALQGKTVRLLVGRPALLMCLLYTLLSIPQVQSANMGYKTGACKQKLIIL